MDKSGYDAQDKCRTVIWDLLKDDFNDLSKRLVLSEELGDKLYEKAQELVREATGE